MKRMNEGSNGQMGGNRRREKMNGKCVPPNLNKKVLTGPHSEATSNNTWSSPALLFTQNKLVARSPDKIHLPQVCCSMQLIT